MDKGCAVNARLQSMVDGILQRLAELTSAQLEAFQSHNQDEFARLDRELEQVVGEKERAIGAMRQHVLEHGCQPARRSASSSK